MACCGRARSMISSPKSVELDRLPPGVAQLLSTEPLSCSRCSTKMSLINSYPVGSKRYQQWKCPLCNSLKGIYLD